MQIGEGTSGSGAEAVTVTTVMGDRTGPVGSAWATAIATPSMGHSPRTVVARPGLPVVPLTLMVPAVGVGDQRHVELTYGAAQAGIAAAMLDAHIEDPDGENCVVVSVWVDASADDVEAVFGNTRDATTAALKQGAAGGPWPPNLAAIERPENTDFR